MSTVWQSCSVNCGAHCALRFHVRDGRLGHVESDTLPEREGAGQMRACLRGRSMRWWLDAPERLDTPLRRTGPRGSGRFEAISWNEALDEVAGQIRRVIERHGNDAVLIPYATGLWPGEGSPFERLMNCLGGYLRTYGDYSSMQLQAAHTATFGDDGYYSASTIGEAENADLVLFFGNNPAETRMGGASACWEFTRARERGSFKLICLDPRHSDTAALFADEWIALRPGTDAALMAGVAHELIRCDLVDRAFLDAYCVGFSRETLPAGAPANGSYEDYVRGSGPDGLAKTPAWASAVTGVPAVRIAALAHEIAAAKALFVAQGWGPQRHAAGELTARAIPLLALLTGNVGLPGTNAGARERFLPFAVSPCPMGDNAVEAQIPAFLWSEAVLRGAELTAVHDGVRGAERLRTPVKLIINHAGNCLTNQHADINRTHDILADEGLCEFIVACDVQMTDSVRYADIVLPDVARAEQANLVSSGSADIMRALVRGGEWQGERAERRSAWDVARDLAARLGVEEAFLAAGASEREHAQRALEEARAASGPSGTAHHADAALPAFDELERRGIWRAAYTGPTVAYADFRRDPAAFPLPTPSGKIEIYSEQLAQLAAKRELAPGEVIHPLPVYTPVAEGWDSPLRKRRPFQLIGYHAKQRTHSSYGNVGVLNRLMPHAMQVNPLDAAALDVVEGERVMVESERGALVIAVHVTPRIMPGVIAIPQGAWHAADMQGDRVDHGGCINTLTSARPTPLAKGNPQHTCLASVRPLTAKEREDDEAFLARAAYEREQRARARKGRAL